MIPDYINRDSRNHFLPALGRVMALLADGAKIVKPKKFVKNLICVIDSKNLIFESVLRVNEEDFRELLKDDGRTKTFMIYSGEKNQRPLIDDEDDL